MAKNKKNNLKKTVADSTETVIYIGPTIRGTLLKTFGIFADGIPAEYREHPTLKNLFILPANLETAKKQVARTGTLLYTYYQRAVEEFIKGGKQ